MRLFVTVGTQFPFDRLVRCVDEWLESHREVQAFAQVGPTAFKPRNMEYGPFIDAERCRREAAQASVIIAHAGMGSILTALELGKPIIVMPRHAALDEHRNDHQHSTAQHMLAQGRVIVAFDEAHLLEKLNHLDSFYESPAIHRHASPRLLGALRRFVTTGQRPLYEPMPDTMPADESADVAIDAEPASIIHEATIA